MVWAAAGLVTGIAFLLYGIDRIDEAAEGAYAVRPLLLPGIVLLWPLVLWRWWVLSRGSH
ncbi:hypothetical protein [uncultured Roseibium sp.]|uniref:hypothetical protein n=1 Tax=uncultured Roseibium sp. TaxID=1936171 RepID=UPI00321678EF